MNERKRPGGLCSRGDACLCTVARQCGTLPAASMSLLAQVSAVCNNNNNNNNPAVFARMIGSKQQVYRHKFAIIFRKPVNPKDAPGYEKVSPACKYQLANTDRSTGLYIWGERKIKRNMSSCEINSSSKGAEPYCFARLASTLSAFREDILLLSENAAMLEIGLVMVAALVEGHFSQCYSSSFSS